jgi:hypothetical protein
MRTLLLLHGETGGWDEVVIAVAAFGVLWIAVKLAGCKPAAEDQDDDVNQPPLKEDKEHQDPAHPPAAKLG